MLFPDPETPVTVTNLYNGILTEIFLRLFSLTPIILINSSDFLLNSGTVIFSSFFIYFEVKVLHLIKLLKFP